MSVHGTFISVFHAATSFLEQTSVVQEACRLRVLGVSGGLVLFSDADSTPENPMQVGELQRVDDADDFSCLLDGRGVSTFSVLARCLCRRGGVTIAAVLRGEAFPIFL